LPGSILSVKKFFRAYIAWWLVWGSLQVILFHRLGFNWHIAMEDSAISNICIATACLLISHIMQFYLPQRERFGYVLIISILLSFLVLFISKWLLTYFNSGDQLYIDTLTRSLPIRFGINFLLIACVSMISILWYTFQDQKENNARRVDAEKLTKNAELFKLRQQLQPHFLFNSLNSISALVGSRPEEARHMIQQLSDFLRGTIKKEDAQIVTLEEELQHLQLYLDIEKVRFGHRLITNIINEVDAAQYRLPSLLLQPIVENAIKFGLYDTIEAVSIDITIKIVTNQLIIVVQNPFDATTASTQKGEGFGVSSVQRRLYLLFARKDLVTTTAHENIFTTTIKIPQLT
jgi:two-component system, LytTR family, sensor kinase